MSTNPHTLKARQQRKEHNRPSTVSATQRPTLTMRRRHLAALLLEVEDGQVSNDILEEFTPLFEEVVARLSEHAQRDDCGHSFYAYVTRYFGFGRAVMSTAEIQEELGVARTTVMNSTHGGVRWLRHWLEELIPKRFCKLRRELQSQPAQGLPSDPTFWDRVDREAADGCWLWLGGVDLGYGMLKVAGKKVQAHRYAWELLEGPIPSGHRLVCTCEHRHCVNPAHWNLIARKQKR